MVLYQHPGGRLSLLLMNSLCVVFLRLRQMDTSRKEAVQRGIVHLQQRFYICTENGKVASVLPTLFAICCILFPFSFPPVTDQFIAGIELVADRRML